ncbi:MAG: NUDIX domain-containing protein [Chloroflexota bacterium]
MEKIWASVFTTGEKILLPADKIIKFRPSVYAVIQRDDRLLLMHNKHSVRLSLPGGGVEHGETLEKTLRRELLEETGLEITIGRFLGFIEDFFYYDPSDQLYQTYCFFYEATAESFDLLSDDQIEDEESERPRWIKWDDLTADNIQFGGGELMGYLKSGVWGRHEHARAPRQILTQKGLNNSNL